MVNSSGFPRFTGPTVSSFVSQPDQTLDEVVDIAERTRLHAVAIDGDVLVSECLHNKIRHHAAIVRVHTRAVCIKDTCHLDAQLVLAVIIAEQPFSTTLAFNVT